MAALVAAEQRGGLPNGLRGFALCLNKQLFEAVRLEARDSADLTATPINNDRVRELRAAAVLEEIVVIVGIDDEHEHLRAIRCNALQIALHIAAGRAPHGLERDDRDPPGHTVSDGRSCILAHHQGHQVRKDRLGGVHASAPLPGQARCMNLERAMLGRPCLDQCDLTVPARTQSVRKDATRGTSPHHHEVERARRVTRSQRDHVRLASDDKTAMRSSTGSAGSRRHRRHLSAGGVNNA
jgi:hypothetical protein